MTTPLPPQGDAPVPERRRFPRLKCTASIQCRSVLKPQGPFVGSLSKDLSASGIRITTAEFFPVESRVVLLLSIPHLLKPIRAIARIVWTQEKHFTEACECGLQFLEITPEDRESIAGYVEEGSSSAR